MQDSIKWTAEDEARFRDLEQRRKLFNDMHMGNLRTTLERTIGRYGYSGAHAERLAAYLAQNADEVRDALKPFDSGVRPAPPSGGAR